jgi:hypothetical protein
LQTPGGEVFWARDARGRPWPAALLASSSCIHLSLRSAVLAAAELELDRPAWSVALLRLGRAVASRPSAFEPRDRYAMDWYYPVLGGAVTGTAARDRIDSRWDEFVVDGWGVRCVNDRPWVTMAETAELVLALDLVGCREEALRVFAWTQRLRDRDGSYWTGANHTDGRRYPLERPTWTSGAVLLAADALAGGPAAALFGGGTATSATTGVAELEAAG